MKQQILRKSRQNEELISSRRNVEDKVCSTKIPSVYSRLQFLGVLLQFLVVLTAVIAIYQTQQQILDNQQLLNKTLKTMSPVRPTLEISLENSQTFCTDTRKLGYEGEELGVWVRNIGQMASEHIYIDPKYSEIHGKEQNIQNISGLDAVLLEIPISPQNCWSKDSCSEEEVESGYQSIVLTIHCDACDEEYKLFNWSTEIYVVGAGQTYPDFCGH